MRNKKDQDSKKEVLEELIYWANSIPADLPLPVIDGLNGFWVSAKDKISALTVFSSHNESPTKEELDRMKLWEFLVISGGEKKYAELVHAIAKRGCSNLEVPWPGSRESFFDSPNLISEFIRIYTNTRRDINDLLNFVKSVNDIRKGKDRKENWEFTVKTPFFINENNQFTMRSNNLFNILEGIDYDQIRICEICGKLFWATRKDKETCSAKCLRAFKHRKYRKAHCEVINQQRRENYKNKKEGKVK